MSAYLCPASPAETEQAMLQVLSERCSAVEFEVLRHAAPILAELLHQAHDHPTAHFYAAVREVVIERCPMRMSGVCDDDQSVEQYVSLLCEIMEQMRCEGLRGGAWSDAPCPQQFFG